MQVSYSIDINCTPDVVFRWLEKSDKAMVWMTSVSKTKILHETSDMVGTTFRETVAEDGNGIEMQGVITGYERNRSISFHLHSQVNTVDVEYRIEEISRGVRLKENANVQWKFPINLLSIFGANKMRQSIIAQLQGEFNRLKELCEHDAANAPNTWHPVDTCLRGSETVKEDSNAWCKTNQCTSRDFACGSHRRMWQRAHSFG